jgi:predicted nucleic acid-binding protein
VWCSCTIIDYLKGAPKAADCKLILAEADAGRIEILVSIMALVEVAKVDGLTDEDAEERIQEFFDRPYVIRVAVDLGIARRARALIREFSLSGVDAVHVATALEKGASIFETFDEPLIKKIVNGGGIAGLTVRPATYEGPRKLL